jgi:hypothetical protein
MKEPLFMADLTLSDLLHEAHRELTVRSTVYPNWVAAGRIRAATAEHRIRAQEGIVATLAALVAVQEKCAPPARGEQITLWEEKTS